MCFFIHIPQSTLYLLSRPPMFILTGFLFCGIFILEVNNMLDCLDFIFSSILSVIIGFLIGAFMMAAFVSNKDDTNKK